MFLDSIRHLMCHPVEKDIVVLKADEGILQCQICRQTMNAFDHIVQPSKDPFASSKLAHEYAQWTGNIHTPCTLPIVNLPGILPTTVVTSVRQLKNAIRLLTLLNKPFVEEGDADEQCKNEKILEKFFSEYVEMVENTPCDSTEGRAVVALLQSMKNMFDVNLLEHYYRVVVPYVRQCGGDGPPMKREDVPQEPLAYQFYQQSNTANAIRHRYAKYCIPFDVIYIMVYCYVCGNEYNVLSNLVFDLMARACKGYFASGTHEKLEALIQSNITHSKNTQFYYVLREIREGRAVEALSSEFLEKFARLDQFISKKFHATYFNNVENELTRFTLTQSFPFVLFRSNADYFGFVLSTGFLITKAKAGNGKLTKGVLGKAKKLYRFIGSCTEKIQNFDIGENGYWTSETFQLFLASEVDIQQNFEVMMKLLSNDSEE